MKQQNNNLSINTAMPAFIRPAASIIVIIITVIYNKWRVI